MSDEDRIGRELYQHVAKIFPICRSITGQGARETLRILSEILPLTLHHVPTGTKIFDWSIPKEWNIRDAYIADESGRRIIDFRNNNLHVVGYSAPIDRWMTLQELQAHLYSIPEQPTAIPYVTSYYKERSGFCIAHQDRLQMKEGKYRVVIDSTLEPGQLTYGECVIPGQSTREVFLSTNICHPSMANNECSGPVVTAFIGKWLASQPRRFTYRIVFIPETIGSLTYIHRHLDTLKKNVIAGFNISCIGDERTYSYVASRYEKTFADKVVANVLSFRHPGFIKYSYLDRGSDERQYGSPGVDLPYVALSRSKYGTYPEYHTSLDNLDFVTPKGLQGGYGMVRDCISIIEDNRTYRVTCLGEPQLGVRGLYPNLSTKNSAASAKTVMDVIAYSDGANDLIDISNIIKKPMWDITPIARKLRDEGLLKEIENPRGF